MTRIFYCTYAALALSVLPPSVAYGQAVISELALGRHNDAVFGNIGAFIPFIDVDGTVAYGQFRGGILPSSTTYGTIGFGVRHQVSDSWVLGGHAHLGVTGSGSGYRYQQAILGVEAFNGMLEFRSNAYLPIGQSRHRADEYSALTVETGQIGIRQGYEQAMTAFDVGAGVTLPLNRSEDMSLKLFAGAYAQFAEDIQPVYGVSGGAELRVSDLNDHLPGAELTLGTDFTHDRYNGTNTSIYGRISVSFGVDASATDPLYSRVEYNPVVRVQAGAYGHVQRALTSDGRVAGVLETIDETTGDIAAINEVLHLSGQNAILLASGELIVDNAIELANGQIWLGGGGRLELRAEETGTVLELVNSRSVTNVVASNAANDVFRMADYAQIIATYIEGGNTAISAHGVSGISVDDVVISGAAGHGIHLEEVTGASIANVSVSDLVQCASGCGFAYSNPDKAFHAGLYTRGVTDLVVDGFSVDNSTYGVFVAAKLSEHSAAMQSRAERIELRNIDIQNTREEALLLSMADNVAISDLRIDNTGMALTKDSVVFLNTTNASLTRADIAGGINGVMIANAPISAAPRTGNISVADVSIRDTTLGGLFLNPADNLAFRNVTMERTGTAPWSRGIFMLGGSNGTLLTDIEFDNVSVSETGGYGLQAMGDIANVNGALSVSGAAADCTYNVGPWMGSFSQDLGHTFSVNGNVIEPAPSGSLC